MYQLRILIELQLAHIGNALLENKMKPTNPNADTYVEEQKQYLFETYLSHFPANPLVGHPALTHWVTLL